MPRRLSNAAAKDENKMDVICKAERLVDLCDDIQKLNGESLSKDYADDEPRNEMRRELEGLLQGSYGQLTDSQHRSVTLVLHKLILQEGLDHANDKIKQLERDKVKEICVTAREIRDEYHAR